MKEGGGGEIFGGALGAGGRFAKRRLAGRIPKRRLGTTELGATGEGEKKLWKSDRMGRESAIMGVVRRLVARISGTTLLLPQRLEGGDRGPRRYDPREKLRLFAPCRRGIAFGQPPALFCENNGAKEAPASMLRTAIFNDGENFRHTIRGLFANIAPFNSAARVAFATTCLPRSTGRKKQRMSIWRLTWSC